MSPSGYPAGCTEASIDAFWGNAERSPAADEELEMLQNECAAIRHKLEALEKKERYRGLTPAEEEEASRLKAQLSENEDEIQRLNDYDWEEDERCQVADMRLNEALGT